MSTDTPTPTPIETAKSVANFVAQASVAWTVGNVLGNNTNTNTKVRKVQVFTAGYVVASLLAPHTQKLVNEKVDEAALKIEKWKVQYQEFKKSQNEN